MDFDFIPSHNDLESTIILSTLSPVIDTLLPFSSKNKDKVFNHGVLASKEKSLPSSSHRGFKTSKPFHHKSTVLIHGANNPNLGVRHPYFYPLDRAQDFPDCDESRARGFVLYSLEFHILSFILGIPIS
ncbi:hypothetical protein Tco_1241552 [Tanacetum coccineum]